MKLVRFPSPSRSQSVVDGTHECRALHHGWSKRR